jgi:hypothetical protein
MDAHNDFGRVSTLPPLALLSQALPHLSRHELEGVVELLIDRIDAMDPDPDLEDGDSDYCEASDDRGSNGPNALFNGYSAATEIWADEDIESPAASSIPSIPLIEAASRH